ncbi:MAG: hypothetical protein GY748_07310 [Planctomycetaceae bacterium]|nr:hypothetical protein [Planctomycetaceae bacterium]
MATQNKTKKRDKSSSTKQNSSIGMSWNVMAIVLLPIFVIAIQQFLLSNFSQKGIPITDVKMESYVAFESAKRLYLLSVSFLYFSVCILVSGKIIFDLIKLSSDNGKKKLGTGTFLLLCVSSVVGFISIFGDDYLNISIIGQKWFCLALDGTSDCGTETVQQVWFNWGYESFIGLLNLSAIITAFTIPFLIIGAISCLDIIPNVDNQENWKYQTHRFKNYMFGCSAVLILGVVFFKTWTSYPSVLLNHKMDQTIRMGLEALSSSMTMLTGLTYTLIFASFSLPVAYILNRRANVLATNIIGSDKYGPNIFTKVAEKRKSIGLTLTTMELVQSIVALLAPLLTGAFSSMLGSLG